MKYVAVVCTSSDISARELGDFSCFVGESKENVITRALQARERWSSPHIGASPYKVLVGRLVEVCVTHSNYTLASLKVEGKRKSGR